MHAGKTISINNIIPISERALEANIFTSNSYSIVHVDHMYERECTIDPHLSMNLYFAVVCIALWFL